MGATKSMLLDQDIPMHLWAEATRTTMYVHNHNPHRVLGNDQDIRMHVWVEAT